MAAPKGNKFSTGRPKGSKDKIARGIKERILDVWAQLDSAGKSLLDEAEKDPQWFYTNFVKPMIPKDLEVSGHNGGPIENKWIVEIVKPGEK